MKHGDDIYIVFFDGEEAVRTDWSETDSRLTGSRHLAAQWGADGSLIQNQGADQYRHDRR